MDLPLRPPTFVQRLRRSIGILLCACLALIGALTGCGNDKQSGDSDKAAAPTATQSKQPADSATKGPHGTTYDASTKPRDAKIKIALKNTAIVPQFVTARAGQTIVFTNEDNVRHRLESGDNPDFASKTLAKGQTLEYRLRPGGMTWVSYHCTIHPVKMSGYTGVREE